MCKGPVAAICPVHVRTARRVACGWCAGLEPARVVGKKIREIAKGEVLFCE